MTEMWLRSRRGGGGEKDKKDKNNKKERRRPFSAFPWTPPEARHNGDFRMPSGYAGLHKEANV
jgi:hypothetical protein